MNVIQPLDLEAGYRSFSILGQHRLAISVKLFFPLQGGHPLLNSEACESLSELSVPFADEYLPRLSTEFFVAGSAIPPGGKPITAMSCTASLAERQKTIRVVGNRYWTGGLSGASEPLPFTDIPLDWKHAFGGKSEESNPLGKGIAEVKSEFGEKLIPLPNLENPSNMVTGKGQRPGPTCFASMPQEFRERMDYIGTCDEKWRKERFPGYPDDFNMKAFYSAQKEQRFDRFLTGGESYELENMNADHPLITGTLPQYRIRAFVTPKHIKHGDLTPQDMQEAEMRIDSVVFYPNQNIGAVIYRGALNADTDDASHLKHLLCAYEAADQPPRSRDHYFTSLIGRTHKDLNMQFSMTTRDLIPDGIPCGISQLMDGGDAMGALAENMKAKAEELTRQAKESAQQKLDELVKAMKAAGKSPEEINARLSQALADDAADEWQKKYQKIFERLAPIDPETGKTDLPKVDFRAFADLMDLSEEHSAFQLQQIKDNLQQQAEEAATPELQEKLQDILLNLERPPVLPRPENPEDMLARILESRKVIQQQIEAAQLQGVKPPEMPAFDESAMRATLNTNHQALKTSYRQTAHLLPQGTPPLTEKREDVFRRFTERQQRDESHHNQDYAGLDFSEMNLKGIDFSGCYLEQCIFYNADLTGANLSSAIMARCDFSNAKLNRVDLTNANIGHSDFTEASLKNALFSDTEYAGCNFTSADLSDTDLSDTMNTLNTVFRKTRLHNTRFSTPTFIDLDFSSADLSGAGLNSATFINCKLPNVTFDQADISESNFIDCNMNQISFRNTSMKNARFMGETTSRESDFFNALADDANFRECDISKSKFHFTSLKNADFGSADATHTDFSGALMDNAQCMSTDFGHAKLSNTNLLGVNFMKARLTAADVSGSNCYGAEFMGATVGKTNFSGSVMDATKLEHWKPSKW